MAVKPETKAGAEAPLAIEPKARTGAGEAPKLRRRKAAAPRAPQPAREALHTLEQRIKELRSLPSLKQPAPETRPPAVDPQVRPPAPAPAPQAKPAEMIDRGLPIPEHYRSDRLQALVRDPHWIFLYWELKGGVLPRLRQQHGAAMDQARWVLRAHVIDENQSYFVDVALEAGNWYLKVRPETAFRFDLGFIDAHNQFFLAVRGNEVRTPPDSVASVVDERWMIRSEELLQLLRSGGESKPLTEPAPRPMELFCSYLAQAERSARK